MGGMETRSDGELLREYAATRAERPFAEIVRRHKDLVYSAAARQAHSAAGASDISQIVFGDLARRAEKVAKRMGEHQSLAGWLYRATRLAALQSLRAERRRLLRERQLVNEFDSTPAAISEWEEIEPILDEAVNKLPEEDRTALLLRYFQRQEYRSVGRALGVSDDAAQKRVARALEKLRSYLQRRGVGTSNTILGASLATHAVQAAPAAAAAGMAAAGLFGTAAGPTAALASTGNALFMTTIQKAVAAGALLVFAGAGIYQTQRAWKLESTVAEYRQSSGRQAAALAQLQADLAKASAVINALRAENDRRDYERAELLRLRGEVTQLRNAAEEAQRSALSDGEAEPLVLESAMKQWIERAEEIKHRLAVRPDQSIPEIELLTPQDWLEVAKTPVATEEDWRKTLSRVREAAQEKVKPAFMKALQAYEAENGGAFGGAFPTNIAQLQGYFEEPLAPAIIERYTIRSYEELMGSRRVPPPLAARFKNAGPAITQRAAIDKEYDRRLTIRTWGSGASSGKGVWD